MRFSLRVYRLLLKLYPASFREDYHAPLQQQFRDELVDVSGSRDLARFWGRTLWDFAQSMPVQLAREIGQDSRHALRLWRQRPAHTLFTIAVLAIATGANTGVFSVLNAVLLRSLPFTAPDRLVLFRSFGPPRNEFHTWRQQSQYLSDATTFDSFDANVEGVNQATRLRLTETSWNFFAVVGAPAPAAGRFFAPGEDAQGQNLVAVISAGLWHQLFGGDPSAIGSRIRVNGAALTIVGVGPAGFDYPERTDIWSATTFDWMAVPKTGVSLFFTTLGRLKPELTREQANHAFEAEAFRAWPEGRNAKPADRPGLVSLRDQLAGPVAQASFILMGGVMLLLLLACANIANLLLARTVARSNELMIRTALGASRARLTQQLLTETMLLSALACLAGLVVAQWTARVAGTVQPAQLATQWYTVLDWRVLAFAIVLSLVTGLVFGVGPALYALRGGFAGSQRYSTASDKQSRARTALIGIQVAVTIVLLTGSIALGRAFVALMRVDVGYELQSIATMSVSLAGTGYEANGRAQSYYDEAFRKIRSVPGVVSASSTEALPLNADNRIILGFQLDEEGPQSEAAADSVGPGYFETIGGRLLVGRDFTSQDYTSTPVAIVNEEFASRVGDPQSVVGRLLTPRMGEARMKPRRIIGVVRGMRHGGPGYGSSPQVFSLSRFPRAATIVVKVNGSARDRIAIIRDAVRSVDSRVPVFNVKTMTERFDAVLVRQRFYATAVAFFGVLGLLLAVIGVYGVTSYSVLQRTREMGIRLALGTTPQRLRAAILRQSSVTIATGALAGIAMAIGFGRYLQSLVQGADSAIVATSTLAVLVTGLVAACATWSATRHIARLDIAEVLRAESAE